MKLQAMILHLALILILGGFGLTAEGQGIDYCGEEKYADCTEAANCDEDSDSDITVCTCKVTVGDSVTTDGCTSPDDGLQSRYPGVPTMGVCTAETKEWADCLGVPCSDEDSDGMAQCQCRIATSKEVYSDQFVLVGVSSEDADQYCSEGLQSSATPGQVFDATSVLRDNRGDQEDPAISWSWWPDSED